MIRDGFVPAIFAGVALALPYVLYAGRVRKSRAVFGIGLVVAAGVYVAFAVFAGAFREALIEGCGVVLFGGLAVLGIRRSPWFLAAGWMAHVGWDLLLHPLDHSSYAPWWYPVVCIGFDLTVAGAIVGASRLRPKAGSSISIGVLLLLCGCSQPDFAQVRTDFEQLHPGCRVRSVQPGEGDSDNVYLHIRSRCGTEEREDVWLYQRVDGEWRPSPSQALAQVKEASGPFRISSDVRAPVLIQRVEPVFPEALRDRRRRGGVIVLESVVTKEGNVSAVKVLRGEDDSLAPYVVESVKQWRFRPATRNGRPVAVYYNVSVNIDVR